MGAHLLLLTLLSAVPGPAHATAHFIFDSDFETNLNDALTAAGLARTEKRAELFHGGDEGPCFAALPLSARAGWEGAVDYFAKVVSPANWNDRAQYLLRVDLAGFPAELKDDADRQFVAIARGFREAATPAYRACRWTAQDEKNRRWIEDLKPLLTRHEDKIAARLAELYRKPWTGLPIRVDVVETVSWAGANSIQPGGAGGHLLISTEYQGLSSLEVTFHEASHVLMLPPDPVWRALTDAAGGRPPRDLWHVVLFYTTGETVRRILEESGNPGYRPMLEGIYERGTWVEYRDAVESKWTPYLDGKRTLPQAAADLVAAPR